MGNPGDDVTAVIPAYDRADVVGRAVRSALAQTVPPREVLVVDDGSHDDTGAVAAAAGARVLRQDNAGEGPARTVGTQAATTAWVAYLDSDDEWLPHHLASVLAARDAGPPGTDLVSAAAMTSLGDWLGTTGSAPVELGPLSTVWPTNVVPSSGVLARRDAVLAAGGFPAEKYCADLHAWVELLSRVGGIGIPTATSVIYQHPGQVSADRTAMYAARDRIARTHADAVDDVDRLLARLQADQAWDLGGPLPRRMLAFLGRPRAALDLTAVLRHRARARAKARQALGADPELRARVTPRS